MKELWQLELGSKVVAVISVTSVDWPWLYGTIVENNDFDRFRTYFSDESTWDDDDLTLDDLIKEVNQKGKFVLRNMKNNKTYSPITLNQDGTQVVWFRSPEG